MAQVLTFPGVRGAFAVGLSWQHEEHLPKASALRKSARQLGANVRWGVAFKNANGTFQSALCEPIAGVKLSRVKPLGAIVASAHSQPWTGLYHLGGDQYWYIAVRQAQAIVAGGDQVGTLAELASVRAHHQSLGGWTEIEGTLDDLAGLARQASNVPALRDVQTGSWRTAVLAATAIALVAGTAFGGWYLYDQQQEAERQAALARQRAAASARQAAAAAQQRVKPWMREPTPAMFFEACRAAWHDQSLAKPGWPLVSWHCKPRLGSVPDRDTIAVETSWSRDGGLAADAPGALSADGQSANDSREISNPFGPPSNVDVLPLTAARKDIWMLAHAHGLSLRLSDPPPPPAQPDKNAPPPDPWIAVGANLTLAAPPWLDLAVAFERVPGLRITDLGYDARAQQWTANGTLYTARGAAPVHGGT
jgi:hypothetical protein